MKRNAFYLSTLLLVVISSGCGLFTSHYDEIRHENFTRLKAIHFKLFDDWGYKSNITWNKETVSSYCSQGDLAFREAYEYAKSKDDDDKTGQKAVKILWDEFSDNCKLSLKRGKLFSKIFQEEIVPEIKNNYEYAIRGELSRIKPR